MRLEQLLQIFMTVGSFSKLNCSQTFGELIYENIGVTSICIRRLNTTDYVGCQCEWCNAFVVHFDANENGNIGFVQMVYSREDLKWMLFYEHLKAVVAVAVNYDIADILVNLGNRNNVVGVVLFDEQVRDSLRHFGGQQRLCDDNCKNFIHWSPELVDLTKKLNLFYFNFPIFVVTNRNHIKEIEQCYHSYAKHRLTNSMFSAFCAMKLNARMFASENSVNCLRRNMFYEKSISNSLVRMSTKVPMFCKPVDIANGFATLFETSIHEQLKNRSVVVFASRIDSLSMFSGVASVGNSFVNLITVFLSVVKTLSALRQQIKTYANGKNILFSLFEGESFNLIGSSRTALDMVTTGLKPTNSSLIRYMTPSIHQLHHWSHFIEINELLKCNGPSLSAQYNLASDNFLNILQSMSNEFNFTLDASDKETLSKSSANSFVKYDPMIQAIVFKMKPSNCDTCSHFKKTSDNQFNMTIRHLTNISTLLSKSLFHLITRTHKDISTDHQFVSVESVLECFVKNSSCLLLNEVNCFKNHIKKGFLFLRMNQARKLFDGFPNFFTLNERRTLVSCIHDIFAYIVASDLLRINKDDCQKLQKFQHSFSYDWMKGPQTLGVCVMSTRFTTETSSSPFINEVDFKSGNYSIWAESNWQTPSAQLFLVA
ncbi:nicastrin-like isoform X1, partial [Leptotrombidium deliense]